MSDAMRDILTAPAVAFTISNLNTAICLIVPHYSWRELPGGLNTRQESQIEDFWPQKYISGGDFFSFFLWHIIKLLDLCLTMLTAALHNHCACFYTDSYSRRCSQRWTQRESVSEAEVPLGNTKPCTVGFSHFSVLCLFISSPLHSPVSELEMYLSKASCRMSQSLKCSLGRRAKPCLLKHTSAIQNPLTGEWLYK